MLLCQLKTFLVFLVNKIVLILIRSCLWCALCSSLWTFIMFFYCKSNMLHIRFNFMVCNKIDWKLIVMCFPRFGSWGDTKYLCLVLSWKSLGTPGLDYRHIGAYLVQIWFIFKFKGATNLMWRCYRCYRPDHTDLGKKKKIRIGSFKLCSANPAKATCHVGFCAADTLESRRVMRAVG